MPTLPCWLKLDQVVIYQSWIFVDWLSEEHDNEVEKFARLAWVRNRNDLIRYPYMWCYCLNKMKDEEIKDHFYTQWIWHGEIELFAMSTNQQDKG